MRRTECGIDQPASLPGNWSTSQRPSQAQPNPTRPNFAFFQARPRRPASQSQRVEARKPVGQRSQSGETWSVDSTLVPRPPSTYYQISISCCLMDVDLISKILKILLDRPSEFSGARLFQKCQFVGFPKCGVPGRNCPDGGHQSTNKHKTWREHKNFLKRFQRK